MSDSISREEMQSAITDKIAVAEARADTKFAEVLGKIDVANKDLSGEIKALSAQLGALDRATSGTKATIIGTGIAVVAVVIGVLAFGQQWFSIGLSTRDIVRATVSEMRTQGQPGAR